MVLEQSDLTQSRALETDICIVGSGAAGLSLAAEFVDTRRRVLILESGCRRPTPFDVQMNELECIGLRHDGGREGRARAFGGTTLLWGGQLMPLRESEVQQRSWVGYSGWPLALREIEPYYRRAEQLLGVEGPPYDAAVWKRLDIAPLPIDESRFHVRFSQWAPLARRNFAVLLHRRIVSSQNVTVLLDATATSIHCSADGSHVDSIEARSRTGRTFRVKARQFVIACGAIETARLLLASDTQSAIGVANSSGAVGRFFQDHISYMAGELVPRSRAEVQRLFDPRYLARTMFTAKLEATDRLQRDRQWLNVLGHLAFEIPEALGLLEVKRILRALQAGRLAVPKFAEVMAMARGSRELARLVLARVLHRRRATPTRGGIALLVDVDQAPNPHSRVLLSTAVDGLGMRKAVVDWRMTGQEVMTLEEFSRLLASELQRLGLATVALAGSPDFNKRNELSAARDTFHHIGTARMSVSPRDGVTNRDLRCHDLDNLYIAGASVFPTGGISNPTLTIIALSIRLADHLKQLALTAGASGAAALSAHTEPTALAS